VSRKGKDRRLDALRPADALVGPAHPLPSFPNGIELDEGADGERSQSIGYVQGLREQCVCVWGGGGGQLKRRGGGVG